MIYEDVGSAGYYSNVAFNGTIEVVEKPKLVDMEGIFMYIMIIGVLGGSGEGARAGVTRVSMHCAACLVCWHCAGKFSWLYMAAVHV